MTVVGRPLRGRLPFTFHAHGGVGRLVLAAVDAGPVHIDRLELEVTDPGTDPGAGAAAERFQRRRTRLRALVVRIAATALDDRVEDMRRHLAGLGITQVRARLGEGFVSVRARASDGLATADVSLRVQLVTSGTHLRTLASHVRVHGHLPTPGPVIADRLLVALFGASDVPGAVERPHARGLCDVEIDLIGALLWHLMPPAGWRLPAVAELELIHVRIGRTAIELAYGPAGSRTGELGVRPTPVQLAAAHDLMHSADDQLRSGHVEDAMRGYRALFAAGGPDQPHLLERILALAAARPAWFFDGLELARQALGRWPHFSAAHAALASITLAQGDAREAASQLTQIAQLASADGDDDQASLAALAGARLLRVLEPKAATLLYEHALEHDPSSTEAADALADRLVDEQRWPELVRLLRARAAAAEPERAVSLRLRLADIFVHQLADPSNAQLELAAARALAPDDVAVHEMTATILAGSDPQAAIAAWREVARLAEARSDHRAAARALATVGGLLPLEDAELAWRRALALDGLQAEAIVGLAAAAATRGDHVASAELYERLRGLGLPQHRAAFHELQLARSLLEVGRADDARASLRRAVLAGGETAAEAHAMLAEIAEATFDRDHAAAELDTAIGALVGLVHARPQPGSQPRESDADDDRLYARAAELAVARARLFDKSGQAVEAAADWERAHALAHAHAPAIARDAARTMLARSPDPISERRWIDAVLATRPPAAERGALLVHRADVRRREHVPDLAGALADLHEALALIEDDATAIETRRRAHQLEAELFAATGDRRARAQALAALAHLAERGDRVETETAAAAAWLAADEPAAALPHGARAQATMESGTGPDVSAALRREVLTTLGEAGWRQRAWADVIRAYRGLIDEAGGDPVQTAMCRYRLAVAADRTGDPQLAIDTLRPLVDASPDATCAASPEVHGPALRLYSDLAERAGDLGGAAAALEGFADVAIESTPSARADAMYRAGELFRRADRGDDAVRCLEGALRISDTHLPALDGLEVAWRDRGDHERVSVILGRKVAATARHPQRQKPLLSRLGDLQDLLGRPDVALATHQRALEIDPTWRPSLRYATTRLVADGAIIAAVAGFAQLAGELSGDSGVDSAIAMRERQLAVTELARLVAGLDDGQLATIRSVAAPVLERAGPDGGPDVAAGLARLRGEPAPRPAETAEDVTPSGRVKDAPAGALSLRDGANRARAAGKLDDAFAALEAANHVAPGDPLLLRELVELAAELGDHVAGARHLAALADVQTGATRAETLQQLADVYYDKLDDAARGRAAMRAAADAFGTGTRRDATLRLLATEAASHLAWDVAALALTAIGAGRQTSADLVQLATAQVRAGRLDAAVRLIEDATATGRFDDGGKLHDELRTELERRTRLGDAAPDDRAPSVTITGTPAENAGAVAAAAASADRERLLAAHRAAPDDPGVLLALLAHLADREPELRRQLLDTAADKSAGRAQAIALHELALVARGEARDPIRASAVWMKAHRVDPSYPPVWMPLADALAAADELDLARELYEQIARSDDYDAKGRLWAAERAEALGRDDSIVSGEIGAPASIESDLTRARELAGREDWSAAIALAERAAAARPGDPRALGLLEELYLESGDVTAASEAIGRQLVVCEDPVNRAVLWRRRAKLYRDALGRDAEAYRCLKEAHACAPADPEIAYQLRTAAMVRGEWALVASLLYREIAAAPTPRDRGALHLELALIYQEKLDDPAQAQVNYEQALAFDPSIPAVKAPLARRYEAIGRCADAARLFDQAAVSARAVERAGLLAAAARCRATVDPAAGQLELADQLERAEASGDTDAALEVAHQLWRAAPGHAAAFRALAKLHRASGDLPALTEITTVRVGHAGAPDERASAWVEVARLADELGQLAEAARAYDRALVENPGQVDALDARGALAFRLGDWATADLIYRDLRPGESVLEDDELALRRSVVAERLGRNDEALALAQVASAAAPGRHDLLTRVQDLATRIGDVPTALAAARAAVELVPLDDDVAVLAAHSALVELYRAAGDVGTAIGELERIVRDHPHHAGSLEQLAELHIAKGDWPTATRYLYQLVPLATTPADRAERLYRLGEATLVHLGDVDRADDVFLRASDLDPKHVPTLRRLLDVYWRADDPAALVEVATELVGAAALVIGPVPASSLAHAVIAAALVGETGLAGKLVAALGDDAPDRIAAALGELVERAGRFELASASTAIAELGRRGLVDVQKIRAVANAPVANHLSTAP